MKPAALVGKCIYWFESDITRIATDIASHLLYVATEAQDVKNGRI